MGIISPTMPTVGQSRGAEEIDLANAVQAILNEMNGSLDSANVASGSLRYDDLDNGADGLAVGVVSASASTSVPDSAWTKIALVEGIDVSSWFASNRYTPQVAGYYHVDIRCHAPTSADEFICALYKNGGRENSIEVGGKQASALSGADTIGVSGIIQMNGSSDYLELFVYQEGAGGAQTFTGRMSVHLIGRS
jgi:hypothetical protein